MKGKNYVTGYSCVSSRDEKLLYFSRGSVTTVQNRETGEILEKLKGVGNVNGYASPDGQHMAFFSHGGVLKVFETGIPHKECFRSRVSPSSFGTAGFVENGKYILAGYQGEIYAYKVPTGEKEVVWKLQENHFIRGCSTTDNRVLFTSAKNIHSQEPTELLLFTAHDEPPRRYTISNDNLHTGLLKTDSEICVLMGSQENEISLYSITLDANLVEPYKKVSLPLFGAHAASFTPDGRFFSYVHIDMSRPAELRSVAYLYRTDIWEVVKEVVAENIWDARFSEMGNYWIIAAAKSQVISLESFAR